MLKQSSVPTPVALAGLFLLAATAVVACDTPVYRYAMYRWIPTPYEVYFFHEDFFEEKRYDPHDMQLHQALDRSREDLRQPANVALFPVNLFVDQDLRGVPPDVRKMWHKQADKSLPKYMIVSPNGSHVFSGGLAPSEVSDLVASPTRDRIHQLLAEGRTGVFVLLTGTDQQANVAAETILDELAHDVAAGKVQLSMGPQPNFGESEDAAEPQQRLLAAPASPSSKENAGERNELPEHQIGVVKLARHDPQERWLVEMLLAIESDLKDEQFQDEPMIFVTYGRARALPPYIGKGITRDHMLEVLHFITSACSCTVKEQNPGVDLLSRYDWESAAERLADKFGSEEGNEGFYSPDEFFPELLIGPASTTAEKTETGTTESVAPQGLAESAQPVAAHAKLSLTPGHDATTDNAHAALDDAKLGSPTASDVRDKDDPWRSKGTVPKQTTEQVAAIGGDSVATTDTSSSENVAPIANSWMYTIAIGVGIGLFLLIGVSFVLFRRR